MNETRCRGSGARHIACYPRYTLKAMAPQTKRLAQLSRAECRHGKASPRRGGEISPRLTKRDRSSTTMGPVNDYCDFPMPLSALYPEVSGGHTHSVLGATTRPFSGAPEVWNATLVRGRFAANLNPWPMAPLDDGHGTRKLRVSGSYGQPGGPA